jgi:hypothetical protein
LIQDRNSQTSRSPSVILVKPWWVDAKPLPLCSRHWFDLDLLLWPSSHPVRSKRAAVARQPKFVGGATLPRMTIQQGADRASQLQGLLGNRNPILPM